MNRRQRRTFLIAFLSSGIALVFACSDHRPEAVSGSASVPTTSCTTPGEGCGCESGTQVACAYEVSGDQNFLFCAPGTRTCTNGTWGACVAGGTMSVRTRASTLHTMSLGASGACALADGGPVNPCDPDCQVYSDTPTGLDAGNAFVLRDGGLVATGCGDGVLRAPEECDDGNVTSGDGCSASCKLETGFKCPTPGAACSVTRCGDGVKEGTEQCDDGNVRPYDGCSPVCLLEPSCGTGECVAVCGDGIKFPSEACDDGNTANGDGCSSTCTIETGATCSVVTTVPPATISLPILYRDFKPSSSTPDFETFCCGLAPGIVKSTLAADGRPAFNASQGYVQDATSFGQWYHDSANGKVLLDNLTLARQADGSYSFYSSNFFPIDNLGWGNYAGTGHNFHFTSELRYPFTFAGGESFEFKGDDDVFVFINGKLVVDLGGVHGEATGSVTLNAATATSLGLVVGKNYEIAVFQAERHTTGSNYKLTLRGFDRQKSVCALPSSLTLVRDFEAKCTPGTIPVWQLFRWRALVPSANAIEFRAATADTLLALPSVPLPAPVTVSAGTATPTNSPVAGPEAWNSDVTTTAPITPVPVSKHLKDEANVDSKRFLRVFMTFKPSGGLSPRLDEWQQLYDCVANE